MGSTFSALKKVSYKDVQQVAKRIILHKNGEQIILINTLLATEQDLLIPNTIAYNDEVNIINGFIRSSNKKIHIIVYGKNSNDTTIITKYKQLIDLGFLNVYVYMGGMFEWCLLQDIYGENHFPTTKKELDILKFAPENIL